MGFMDKAKEAAKQAQKKLDEVQSNFNESQAQRAQQGPPPVQYDKHGRPIQQPAASPAPGPAAPMGQPAAPPAPGPAAPMGQPAAPPRCPAPRRPRGPAARWASPRRPRPARPAACPVAIP